MTSSGLTGFSIDIADVMEEAFERVGREMRSGYDGITARRSLNIVLQEMTNAGVDLWQMDQQSLPLSPGVKTYELEDDTLDIIGDGVIRVPQGNTYFDIPCVRILRDAYLVLPNKDQPGRPYQFFVERLPEFCQITFWPVPNVSGLVFNYWRFRMMEDVTAGNETADMPKRAYPALIAGLAFHLANKAPQAVDGNRRAELKAQYNEALQMAMAEDRDRTPTIIVPYVRGWR